MKKIFSILTLAALLFSVESFAQLDRSKAPEPGPAPKVEMGSYEKFTLKNGLKVIVVENSKRPVVTASLNFYRDPVLEGDKAGLLSIYGDLWSKGTKKRSAEEINEEVDFIGASFGTSSTSIYFYSLSKYTDKMMQIMTDVLYHPAFPKAEMDKLKTQYLSFIESSKTDPDAIKGNMEAAVIYGPEHPYGDIVTESTINNITVDDCKAYYKKYIMPNQAILIFVGDITLDQAKALSEKYFGKWKMGKPVEVSYPEVSKPEGINVVFSAKDGAVQSSIEMAYPIDLKPGAEDLFAVSIANYIYGGGGFSAKLMKNLREDKGYTYGAYSSVSPDLLSGSFSAAGEVNANATDSSFIEMAYEMRNMLKGDYDDMDFKRAKAAYAGSFSRSLEQPSTIADYAYTIERYGLPEDYFTTYLQRLDALTREEVQAAVEKYFDPDNAYYFVVGDPSVLEGLAKLDSDGEIVELDYKGEPVVRKEISGDVTAESVIESYLNYMGGRSLIENIKSFSTEEELEFQGVKQITTITTEPGKSLKMTQSAMGNTVMADYNALTGTAIISSPQGTQFLTKPEEVEPFLPQTYPVLEAVIGQFGITAELEGMESVDGTDAYKVKFTQNGMSSYTFYDAATGAKIKETVTAEGMTQETVYSNYQKTSYGLMFPMKRVVSVMGTKLTTKVTKVEVK